LIVKIQKSIHRGFLGSRVLRPKIDLSKFTPLPSNMNQQIIFNIGSLPVVAPLIKGDVSPNIKHFRGIVTEKNESGDKFVSYKIADTTNPNEIFKVLSTKSDYLSLDNMSFDEMHEDVEVGDDVSIYGRAARSKKGSFYIRSTGILVREYGNNEYESSEDGDEDTDYEPAHVPSQFDVVVVDSDEETEEDPEYTPSVSDEESEYSSESEVDSEECSEEDTEEDYQPTLRELSDDCFSIPSIPMTVYNKFVEYQNKYFAIKWIFTDTPFKITLATKLGNFHITKMDSKYIGVFVPGNDLEKDHPTGYDMVVPSKFRNLLKVLV